MCLACAVSSRNLLKNKLDHLEQEADYFQCIAVLDDSSPMINLLLPVNDCHTSLRTEKCAKVIRHRTNVASSHYNSLYAFLYH